MWAVCGCVCACNHSPVNIIPVIKSYQTNVQPDPRQQGDQNDKPEPAAGTLQRKKEKVEQ